MKGFLEFIRLYRAAREWGFPIIWSARASWGWRKGPSPMLLEARRQYLAIKERQR